MNGVDRRQGVVNPVKDILLVPFVVEDDEFRGIEKASGIQAVGFDEISPFCPAVGEVRGCPTQSRTIHSLC